ncbi:hypothetical protein ABEB36_005719 [Hypothenemus hampei]|uniref:NADH dehydrogenase [ubiquinone] 1 beta subcomplex subunit 2, mitochondrial n=1 Tax=Hypothenemus hampei TaxID=57062 RepID=A0ABD1EZ80_HYPHA
MLLSRVPVALRAFSGLSKHKTQLKQSVRYSGDLVWAYRTPPPRTDKKFYVMGEVAQGFMWWWIFWHLWTEPDHILGEFEYPDARKWTDAELGIPDELEVDE